MSTTIDLERALIDDDQGVCPEGHDCTLETINGAFQRVCDLAHGDEQTIYTGMPLMSPENTLTAIYEADAAGADPALIEWARSSFNDRQPQIMTDDNRSIQIIVDGFDLEIIRRTDGTLFISAAAPDRSQQVTVSDAFINAYKDTEPSLVLRLADRPKR